MGSIKVGKGNSFSSVEVQKSGGGTMSDGWRDKRCRSDKPRISHFISPHSAQTAKAQGFPPDFPLLQGTFARGMSQSCLLLHVCMLSPNLYRPPAHSRTLASIDGPRCAVSTAVIHRLEKVMHVLLEDLVSICFPDGQCEHARTTSPKAFSILCSLGLSHARRCMMLSKIES